MMRWIPLCVLTLVVAGCCPPPEVVGFDVPYSSPEPVVNEYRENLVNWNPEAIWVLFTPRLQAQYKGGLEGYKRSQAQAGTIQKVYLRGRSVQEDTALFHLTVVHGGGKPAPPETRVDERLHLRKRNGIWMIDSIEDKGK